MAFAHASSLAVAQLAADPVAELMSLMPDCDDADGGSQQSDPPCPTSEAAPDWSKLAVFHALPLANSFALVAESERGFAGPVHFGLPRGRAPPRAQLCCWLI